MSQVDCPFETFFGNLFDTAADDFSDIPFSPLTSTPSSPPSRPRASWDDLSPELKLRIAMYVEWPGSIRNLGTADPKLIPHLVSETALPWRQRAYKTACEDKVGSELVNNLRNHLASFWASEIFFYFTLDSQESIDVIQEVSKLRAGRGPEFFFRTTQRIARRDSAECRTKSTSIS